MGLDMDPSNSFKPSTIEESDLAPRDTNILRQIQEEGLTVFSFDGLRRLLGMHQETLSRVLARLQDEGLVEKVADGYRLTSEAGDLFPRRLGSELTRIPILQALLPTDTDIARIVGGLKGRWFGKLHWVGYSKNEDETVLKWITEDDKVQIDAKFANGFLTIEARTGEEKEVSQAVKASHQLIGHISRLYTTPRPPGRFATPIAYYSGYESDWPVTFA